jgi:hypothetical protein
VKVGIEVIGARGEEDAKGFCLRRDKISRRLEISPSYNLPSPSSTRQTEESKLGHLFNLHFHFFGKDSTNTYTYTQKIFIPSREAARHGGHEYAAFDIPGQAWDSLLTFALQISICHKVFLHLFLLLWASFQPSFHI